MFALIPGVELLAPGGVGDDERMTKKAAGIFSSSGIIVWTAG
jgi:hypothetical protein